MSEPKYTSVEEQVEFGLDKIAPERMVEVPLRDLLYVNQVFREMVRFFHQPMHYPTLEQVHKFVGTPDNPGALELLGECYYGKLYDVWPPDVRQMFDDSAFDHPRSPFYYAPTDEDDPSST